VGLFSATAALSYMSMSLPSGALGKRLGTRRVMLAGGIITVFGMALLPFTEFLPVSAQGFWPIGSQIIITTGWSMLNINLVPALMTATTKRNRNNAFAVNGAIRGLGTFLGTLCGGMLPSLFAGLLHQTLGDPAPYGRALWVGAAAGLLALIPLSLIHEGEQVSSKGQTETRGPFPLLPVALMIAYVCLRHGGWATCQAFFNAYMDADLHLRSSSIGLITGAGQSVAILAALVTPRLAARRSNGWILTVTTLGMAVGLVPLALIPHWAAAGFARLCILVLSAIWMPALQVFQMELVESGWRSLAYGAVSMAMGLSFGLTSLLGGYVIAAAGYRSLFMWGAGLSVASAVFMWGVNRRLGTT
jgi:predicted MFS family arabinose efflux permease